MSEDLIHPKKSLMVIRIVALYLDDFNLNGNNNTGDGSNGKSLVVPEGGRRGWLIT